MLHHGGVLSDFRAIFIMDTITLVFIFTAQAIESERSVFRASPTRPKRSRHSITIGRHPAGFYARDKREGEFVRNVGSDRALSLLCSGRRIPPHAPPVEGLLHLPRLWPSHKPWSLLREVRLPEVPEDGRDRPPLSRRIGTQAPDAEPSS